MASNKNINGPRKRPYTLRTRARRREEVHQRITLATVQLHGSVGPARTTVSEIAKIAGVRRATVYNHFPTDRDLLDACSSHWFTENPPPDPGTWAEITDPAERAFVALGAMYGYYDRGREMLEKVLSDAPLVPALEEILQQKWWPMLDGIVEILAQGWNTNGVGSHPTGEVRVEDGKVQSQRRGAEVHLRATLHVALDFFTWKKLAASRLSHDEAARLAVGWAEFGRTLPL
jgi:AcrR family transcriptional regulator